MIKNILIIFLMLSVSIICFAGEIAGNNISMQNNYQAEKYIKELYGSWKIVGYAWSGMFSSEEKNPKKHIGKILFFGVDRAEIMRVSDILCKAPEYNFHYEEKAANYLFNGYRAKLDEVGIKTTSLNVIEVNCAGENNLPGYGPSADVFITSKDTAIYKMDGPFYYLQKVSDKK